MTQATDKQINYANSLGIENAGSYSKEALKELIDKKLNPPQVVSPKDWNKPIQPQATIIGSMTEHQMIIQRVEKPHSYEFGKAGMRHKVYYSTIAELKERVKELTDAGFVDPDSMNLISDD